MTRPIILIILDGFGEAPQWGGNAVSLAKAPTLARLRFTAGFSRLAASGEVVGLRSGEVGNSEVGHLTIGAGRIVPQDSTRISRAIGSGEFLQNQIIKQGFDFAKHHQTTVHLMGLISDGNIHANIDHLFALLRFAKQEAVGRVKIHAFTDGRDTPQEAGIIFMTKLLEQIRLLGVGEVATVAGRWYAMDRDHHWERTEQVVEAMVSGKGVMVDSPIGALALAYRQGITDEFIPPTVLTSNHRPVGLIGPDDAVIFFNFRQDRARQITQRLFERVTPLYMVTFTPYSYNPDLRREIPSAFPGAVIQMPLSEVLSVHHLRQFHAAETEKYAHVTYFFNGGKEKPFPGESRLLIRSKRTLTFDRAPGMAAKELAQHLIDRLRRREEQFFVINFANPDMVGHTGNLKAAISAIEILDGRLKIIIQASAEQNAWVLITGDHGNIEQMIDPKTGLVDTEHTANPVPFFLIPPIGFGRPRIKPTGSLADVAPTILHLFGINQPIEMTGQTLLLLT